MMKLLTLGLALASLSLTACQSDTSMMVESADAPTATELTCEAEPEACEAEMATCEEGSMEAMVEACCEGGGACCDDEDVM